MCGWHCITVITGVCAVINRSDRARRLIGNDKILGFQAGGSEPLRRFSIQDCAAWSPPVRVFGCSSEEASLTQAPGGQDHCGEGGAVERCSRFCRFRMCGGGSEGEQMGQCQGVWVLGVKMNGRGAQELCDEDSRGLGGLRRMAHMSGHLNAGTDGSFMGDRNNLGSHCCEISTSHCTSHHQHQAQCREESQVAASLGYRGTASGAGCRRGPLVHVAG